MRETLLLLLSLTAWHTDIAAQDPTARVSAPALLNSTGSVLLGGFLAAVVLAIPGVLIGGQIHKSEQDGSQ